MNTLIEAIIAILLDIEAAETGVRRSGQGVES